MPTVFHEYIRRSAKDTIDRLRSFLSENKHHGKQSIHQQGAPTALSLSIKWRGGERLAQSVDHVLFETLLIQVSQAHRATQGLKKISGTGFC